MHKINCRINPCFVKQSLQINLFLESAGLFCSILKSFDYSFCIFVENQTNQFYKFNAIFSS